MQKTKIFYGWWVVAACFVLCFLFAGAGFYSFSIFIKPLENAFGWDRAAISLTMSIHFIIGGLMGILWMINAIGGALGTYASGLIYDYTGAYQYALYLFIAAYIVAISEIFLAGKRKPDGRRNA